MRLHPARELTESYIVGTAKGIHLERFFSASCIYLLLFCGRVMRMSA